MNKFIYYGITISIFLVIGVPLFSNDSFYNAGVGSAMNVDRVSTNISMQEEEINITLYKEYYEVDVTMIFYNEGPTENVTLGFPINILVSGYDIEEYDSVSDFKSYVNGIFLSDYIIKEEEKTNLPLGYWSSVTKWFLRQVEFPEKSYTTSRVSYKVQYNRGGFGSRWASYIYGTGSTWKNGNIGKMTIFVNHGDDVYVYNNNPNSSFFSDGKLFFDEFTWEADGRYKYVLKNVQPNWDAQLSIDIGYGARYSDENRFIFDNFQEIKLYTKKQLGLYVNDLNSKSSDGYGEILKKNIEFLLNLGKKMEKLPYSIFYSINDDYRIAVWDNSMIEIIDYIGSENDIKIPKIINGLPVVAIGDSAFYRKQLTNIIISNSIVSIGYSAFSNNQLTSIIIPDSVMTIGTRAFAGNQLTGVTIPNSVISIGGAAFFVNPIDSITVPDSVISIEHPIIYYIPKIITRSDNQVFALDTFNHSDEAVQLIVKSRLPLPTLITIICGFLLVVFCLTFFIVKRKR